MQEKSAPDVPYGSNEIRLTLAQWGVVGCIVATCLIVAPHIWRTIEPFKPTPDYRTPAPLSEDYWHYERWMEDVGDEERIPIIGDSVIWGEYVAPKETLSEQLNAQLQAETFANAGLSGSHPLALEGLTAYYGDRIQNQRVILHCNPLWMTSVERDLQVETDLPFNHPDLVPQLSRDVRARNASADDRIGTMIDRRLAFRGWVRHLRVVHFENLSIDAWTLENPYENPLSKLREPIPLPDRTERPSISWTERGIDAQDFPWLTTDDSLQFQAFMRTVQLLRGRGNRLFVVVGPFNERMLSPASLERYEALKQSITDRLREEDVAHQVAPVLPSEEYADASHPLASGYERMALRLAEDPTFISWYEE